MATGSFFAADKVQVKYEMLRARVVDGLSVTAAAGGHGYSRAGFYLVEAAFEHDGMVAYLRLAPASMSGAALAKEVEARFGVSLHRRTIERARRR